MTFVHPLVCLVIALSVIGALKWSWEQSRPIGVLVVIGVLLRTIAGLALFWISFRHLPILRGLQLGDGFWTLALDARTYYDSARAAAEHGFATISPTSPSPVYVELLALSLRVCGASPLTAVLLNVVADAGACVICASMWPRRPIERVRWPRTVAVGALSLSPSLVLASTQPLKDQVFVLFVVAAIACIRTGLRVVTTPAAGAMLRAGLATAGAAAAIYAVAGIRAYYALFVVVATAVVLTAMTMSLPLRRWMVHIVGTIVGTLVLWNAFVAGGGLYSQPYHDMVFYALHIPTAPSNVIAPVNAIEFAREGFVEAGGGTNIVRSRRASSSTIDKALDEAWGLMVIIVPISVLRALSIVSVTGGRGLLAITDIDTTFIGLTIALQLWIVLRQRNWQKRDISFLSFTFLLAAAALLPMAYVVTNYGTLFRLRIMYAVPLWLSGAAVVTRTHEPR